ncbi:thioesterase family protein [Amycolatopsis sp. 195334CR]|uniref:thioesterase family protein n=1 Tax=Amycolatopsis sp. 195334CR TaxID=2814588 RepID=UPI001A90B11D|nr:hypothetical protein [Amycolatopsis sp. 195334CR]MBN6040421.1 hypothetical protein [Amycolatopsis sp. 195334CR]
MVRISENAVHARSEWVVEPDDCASRWGNTGLEVLSTPAILGRMEKLCADALAGHLDDGEMTVGVEAVLHHRAPTPVGAKVSYHVHADRVDRKIRFDFEVRDSLGTLVCDGTHLRAVIEVAGFQAKVSALAVR